MKMVKDTKAISEGKLHQIFQLSPRLMVGGLFYRRADYIDDHSIEAKAEYNQ